MPDLQSGVIELRICNPQHPLIIHRNSHAAIRITNPRLNYAGLQIQRDVGVEVITILFMLKYIRKIFRPLMICKSGVTNRTIHNTFLIDYICENLRFFITALMYLPKVYFISNCERRGLCAIGL